MFQHTTPHTKWPQKPSKFPVKVLPSLPTPMPTPGTQKKKPSPGQTHSNTLGISNQLALSPSSGKF